MAPSTFTQAEQKRLGNAFQCMHDPKIDSARLEELAGYKNSQTASACWSPLKKKLATKGKLVLTPGDHKMLPIAFKCMGDIKVDTKKLAELNSYKNAQTAGACWSSLKKKLLSAGTGGEPKAGQKHETKKRTGTKRQLDDDEEIGPERKAVKTEATDTVEATVEEVPVLVKSEDVLEPDGKLHSGMED